MTDPAQRSRRIPRVFFGTFHSRARGGDGHTGNISERGLAFRTDTPPLAGDWTEVVLSRPWQGELRAIAVSGVVRWSTALTSGPNTRFSGFGLDIQDCPESYRALFEHECARAERPPKPHG